MSVKIEPDISTTKEKAMVFSPDQHLRTLKGQQYLDVKWRLVWLRDEHPEARIKTDMMHLDMDQHLAVFRAEVTLPDNSSATGYGSETERDFPQGWIEKAETKSIGRALAALGYGTQFALELDEGERIVDSPVSVRSQRGGLKVVAEPAGETCSPEALHALREKIMAALETDKEAGEKLPKSTNEMSPEELAKTLIWLQSRAKRQA